MKHTGKPRKRIRGLLLIAAFKFLKGIGLLLLGFGVLHVLHRDVAAEIARLVDLLRVDPHNYYLLRLMKRVANLDEKRLRELSVGTFFYSALFLTEGAGLALRRRWAEYLTIISTASLLPVEIYETYKGPSMAKVAVLLINVAVVVYLVQELRTASKTKYSQLRAGCF